MGVPAFFRWLSQKYLNIITDAVEEKKFDPDGNRLPVDTSAKNPNGFEVDNLYLDMNGIIHPCTHPEDKPPPKDEDEMMQNVYECIDRLFLIARPRKVLYLAVDGVAPRAKMNQQRSRRFRTAKEAKEAKEKEEVLRRDAIEKGLKVAEKKQKLDFDSNCISPGTEFMYKVARTLAKYAVERLSEDPGFRTVKVIVSDASIPGEGEHKLMAYIRQQRSQPGYDPNTRHVICGLDADLIMLGLATHEPYFSVLREVVTFNKKGCRVCGKEGHFAADCPRTRGEEVEEEDDTPKQQTPYQFLHLNVLREYLDLEFRDVPTPFPFDLERVVDDFVFMCFFVGNDFLPHMPSLEIREGAIELLMGLYKRILPSLGGYITDNGEVIWERAKVLVQELGVMEDAIFVKRRVKEMQFREREKRNTERRERERLDRERRNVRNAITPPAVNATSPQDANRNAAAQLKQSIVSGKRLHEDEDGTPPHKRPRSEQSTPTTPNTPSTPNTPNTPSTPSTPNAAPPEPEDNVQLGLPGWHTRYYHDKFKADVSDLEFMRGICGSYIEGLAWVLRYYYQGCCSWKWFYPYHYAPFATDVAQFMVDFKPQFALGEPFRPFDQLMGILPPASARCVPKAYRPLMGVHSEGEPDDMPISPIIHFYPEDFKIDLNGKRQAWMGIALLPFIDEKELLDALNGLEKQLTQAERNRNSLGEDMLFVNTSHEMAPLLAAAQELPDGQTMTLTFEKGGLSGIVKKWGYLQKAQFGDILELKQNVVGAIFINPPFPPGFVHESKLLAGLTPPPSVLEGYKGEYRGGAGGLGGRDGGYHHGQNAAANRMINHSLGNRQNKNIRTAPRFVPASDGLLQPAFPFAPPANAHAPPANAHAPPANAHAPPANAHAPGFQPPQFGGGPPLFPAGANPNYNQSQQNYNQSQQNYNQSQQNYNQNQGYGNQGGYNQGGGRGGHGGGRGGYQNQGYGNQGGYNQNQGYGNQGGYNQNQGYGNQGGYNQNQGYGNQGGYNQNQGYGNQNQGYGNQNQNQNQYNNPYNQYGGSPSSSSQGGDPLYQSSPYPRSFPNNYNPFAGRGGRS